MIFADTKSNDWFIRDGTLMSAKKAGFLELLEINNEVNPNQPLLREEMAYILAKAAEYCEMQYTESVDLKSKFIDSEIIDFKYIQYVENTVALKLMQGMSH